MKEKVEEIVEIKDEYLEELIQRHKDLGEKSFFTKEENEFREGVKMYLYDEKNMDDAKIAELLNLEETTITHWRHRRMLPKQGSPEIKMVSMKHNYEMTERQLALVRSFVLKYIAREKGRGDNFSLRDIEIDESFDRL